MTDASVLKPEDFEPMLLQWISQPHRVTGGQVVASDGKAFHGSYDMLIGKAAIQMFSVWMTANPISLDPTVVDEKCNEITAIP